MIYLGYLSLFIQIWMLFKRILKLNL